MLESGVSQTSTMVSAFNYLVFVFMFFFSRKPELGHGRFMCGNPCARQVGSSSAPPWRSFGGFEFCSWKMLCWEVEEKEELGIYRALKTKCSFSQEDFLGLVWGRAARSLLRGKGNISLMIY